MRIRSGDISLCAFDASLTDAVYEIRNHPSVRAHLRNTEAISRESHYEWVCENLVRARRVHLFVILAGEERTGIALLRNFRDKTAEVGLMVVDAERRPLVCYVAAHLIGYYAFEIVNLKQLFSYVPRHNEHALSFNLRCGFKPTGAQSEVYHELVLTQKQSRSHRTHKRFRERHGIEVIEDPGS